jgi:hypothetical protein
LVSGPSVTPQALPQLSVVAKIHATAVCCGGKNKSTTKQKSMPQLSVVVAKINPQPSSVLSVAAELEAWQIVVANQAALLLGNVPVRCYGIANIIY